MPLKLKRTFTAPVYLEYSSTSRTTDLGTRVCNFTLVIHDNNKTGGLLCDYGEVGYNDMGLWFDENKTLTDYDGAFQLPSEGIEMIKELGFIVPEDME